MKKSLFALVAGCVSALVLVNGANAQNPVSTGIPEPQKKIIEIGKAIPPVKDHLIDLGAISPKALKDFAKRYKNVTAESWVKIKDGFCAKFISNGVRNTIYYNTKGKWIGGIKSYSEDKLPHQIRDIVKNKYDDYSITYVQEVEANDLYSILTYLIRIEDKSNFKLIRINDGEMDVWEEFKKS